MKSSGSLTELLLDSLVSFVFVATCGDPKQLLQCADAPKVTYIVFPYI